MNSSRIETMKLRANVLSAIRDFFAGRGYTEADVPLLTPAVIPEAPIELFRTERVSPFNSSNSSNDSSEGELFLLPSPEYYLKQLIADGSGDIYSISRSFRNSEQTGRQHNPEFTMLEYYAMDADYMDSIKLTEELFNHLLSRLQPIQHGGSLCPNGTETLKPPFERMSMDEVFEKLAGFDLSKHCTGELNPEEERAQLRKLADRFGLRTSENDSWEELFNLIFVHQIEPNLPAGRPVVIYDYPAGIPALAKPAAAAGRLERWELYAGGAELANCYSEETDRETVRRFFDSETAEKQNALVRVRTDDAWPEMYNSDFPQCSGTALGVDRLMMLISGAKSIEGVILFPLSDIIGHQ